MGRIRLILYGPDVNVSSPRAYGGGQGGYTRNMKSYQVLLTDLGLHLTVCSHTIRGQFNYGLLNFLLRSLIDFARLLRAFSNRADYIHVLAQYRGAILREFVVVLLSKLFSVKVVYDIKAGAFIRSYENGSLFYKALVNFILFNSDKILVEGKIYYNFLCSRFNLRSIYFPNFILEKELESAVNRKKDDEVLKCLFVGYFSKNKGACEIIEAMKLLVSGGYNVSLTIVGEVESRFKDDLIRLGESMKLVTTGKLSHEEALSHMRKSHVYLYPSKHLGEGHNNSINEALMFGLIIITSLAGFTGDFLNGKNAHVISDVTASNLYSQIVKVIENYSFSYEKALYGRKLLLSNFTSSVAMKRLPFYRVDL
jgi:glycosyltransferase involved in cell wall biosynthesis